MRPAVSIAAALMLSLPPAAVAQDGTRASDVRLNAAELREALSGRVLEFFDDSRAVYSADGSYAYAYTPGDDRFRGSWTTTEAGEVCVTFENGAERCDLIVRSGDRLTMIVSNGDRYPARSLTPIE